MIESVLYRVTATVTQSSGATSAASDSHPELQIYTEDMLFNKSVQGFYLEQSFAATCAMSLFQGLRACALQQALPVPEKSSVIVYLDIGHPEQGRGLEFEIDIEVMLPGIPRSQVEQLIAQAREALSDINVPLSIHIIQPAFIE